MKACVARAANSDRVTEPKHLSKLNWEASDDWMQSEDKSAKRGAQGRLRSNNQPSFASGHSAGSVAVRHRSKGDLGPRPLEQFVNDLRAEIDSRQIL